MKVVHTADVQVKNRQENLYIPTKGTLNLIVYHVKDSKAEILLLAGDMFEYAEPIDSERKLIYNFFSQLLNIPTLKEIVLIPGNHDLLKEKKSNDSNIGFNSLNVFVEMLNTLDAEKYGKLIYIGESKIYNSKLTDKIQYYAYSLEDGMKTNFVEPNTNALPICIFHAMLKEYADLDKLPLRKDIYNSLFSVEQFPENSLIPSGDIHKNLTFRGVGNQYFVYPGSPMQHTHKEGSYYTIGEKVQITQGEPKVLKVYEFDETLPKVTLEDITFSEIPLIDTICYNTIELDSKLPYQAIVENINSIKNEFRFGAKKTMFKVKSASTFIQQEQEIFNLISTITKELAPKTTFLINFEYDKFIQTIVGSNNKVIQEIIEEKNQELSEGSENEDVPVRAQDIVIASNNIDDLILSDVQLIKLFKAVLEKQLKGVKEEDIQEDELSEEVMKIFEDQLQNAQISSKRYSIGLKAIETNGFMALGENRIDLDIPGIVRISGTNGIGKTTLYNMLRWVITGDVFPNMSKAQVVKNNLLVFNKNKFDNDFVYVQLDSTVNNVQVYLKRTVERKWKNNVTDEQKMALNWKEYVGGISRKFELQIKRSDGTVSTLVDENAEANVSAWFGSMVNNILFINQTRIENILRTQSDKLNELILDLIGVSYLKSLEDGLEMVKSKLMEVAKPKKSKEDLRMAITDANIFIKKKKEYLDELIENQTVFSKNLVTLDNKKTEENNFLLNLGNIPQQIEDKKTEVAVIQTYLDTFVAKDKKDKIEFTQTQPVLTSEQKTLFEQYDTDIKGYSEDTFNIDGDKTRLEEENTKLVDETIATLVKTQTTALDINNQTINDSIVLSKEKRTTLFEELKEYIDDLIKQFENKQTEKEAAVKLLKDDNIAKQTLIDKNEETIKSGVCSECGKPFEDDFESHKEKLMKENIEYQVSIENNILLITPLDELITKIKKFIVNYKSYRDLIVTKSKLIYSNEVILKAKASVVYDLQKIDSAIETAEKDIVTNTNEKANWNKVINIKHDDFSAIEQLYNPELGDLILTYKNNLIEIEEKKKKINANNLAVSTREKEIKTANDALLEALTQYQKDLNDNIAKNVAVDKYNDSVLEHNNSKVLKENEQAKLTNEITALELNSLASYELHKKYYDQYALDYTELSTTNANNEKSITQTKLQQVTLENDLKDAQKNYDDCLLFQKNNLKYKIYSTLIKDKFKEIVFEYYQTFLNNTLNVLLENVNFKLFWNQDGELYMLSFKNGKTVYQPVQQSSGMETCFLGLALIYTMHLLNVKNSISHIFIDEISGTLNKGKELTYSAQNYQELLVLILNKFKDKTIFVVDHNIDNLFETATYEVQPDDNGSKYVMV